MKKELGKYLNAAGAPAFEKEVFNVMKDHIGKDCDEVTADNLGSLIAVKESGKDLPKVMIAGHLDEIGMMITNIDDNGFIKFQPLGGWWNQNMLAQRVYVVNSKGEKFIGVIGSKPPHVLAPEERGKPMQIKNMYIDIGVASKEEIDKLGIEIGDFIIPHGEFSSLGDENYLVGKAFDNRVGCYIAAQVLKEVYKDKLNINLYAVGSTQEEVGIRGGRTVANKINPDLGISVDIGAATDCPGGETVNPQTKLGDGPLITIFDASMIGHKKFINYVKGVAKANDIKYQLHVIPFGGTDAGAMHVNNIGAPSVYIGIPTRYGHSSTEVVHKEDVENTIKLLVAIVKDLDAEKVAEITFG